MQEQGERKRTSSEKLVPNIGRRYTAGQFSYLLNTTHYGDNEGEIWKTVRVAQDGDNVVVYRRQVMDSGTSLSPNEDGPILAQDVAYMTLAYKQRLKAKTAT